MERLRWFAASLRSIALVPLLACAALFAGVAMLPARALALDVPALKGRVNDYAGLLSPTDADRIERKLAAHERQTGQQFALLTLDTLGDDAIESFSIRTVEQWKLGQKGKDNGLLLVVVKNDRKIRIEVGYGLEGDITDALSSRVIRETIAPAFRSGDYAGGIDRALDRLIRAGGGDPGALAAPAAQPARERPRQGFPFFFVFFVLPFVLWALSRSSRRRAGFFYFPGGWGGGGSWGSRGGGFGGGGGGFGGGGSFGGGGFGGGGGGFGGGGASGSW